MPTRTTREERIAAVLNNVNDWETADADEFYDAHFGADVDRHTFRQAFILRRADVAAATAQTAAGNTEQGE